MIAEAAIAGATVCFVACLRFTRYVIDREDRIIHELDPPNPFIEKRRILERDRAEWMRSPDKNGRLSKNGDEAVREIDRQLIALADEEAAQ